MADNFFHAATSLIGGGFGALDAIDGADLADDDGAVVITGTIVYCYHLNATSGEEESPPEIIAPDDNPGDKRWILVFVFSSTDTFLELTDTPTNYTGSAGKFAKVNVGEDGLEFGAAPGNGGFSSRCSVYRSGVQTIPKTTWTRIELNAEVYDDDNEFASYRFTAKVAGYYDCKAQIYYNATAKNKAVYCVMRKNGTAFTYSTQSFGCDFGTVYCYKDVYLDVDDYIELWTYQADTISRVVNGAVSQTFMTIHRFA